MKYASDFRQIARDALRGKWGIAVVAGLIASMLGAISSNGPEVTVNYTDNGASAGIEFAGQEIYSTGEGLMPELNGLIIGGAVYILIAALVAAVAFFILGSIIELGYARFNLGLVDRRESPEIATLFTCFPHWKTSVVAKLLQTLYITLWSLLFIIPGIIAAYSYAMTSYILAEHPELTPSEAIARSKEMMEGNRWRLFCLQISFIGWSLLCAMTMGIGNLWLTPYRQAATAAFYRDISGTACIPESTEPQTEYL